ICRRPSADEGIPKDQPKNGDAGSSHQSWSDAPFGPMTACAQCACGECWILVGCVTLEEGKGIIGNPYSGDRQWVKPIEALCSTLVDRIGELEKNVASLMQPRPHQGAST